MEKNGKLMDFNDARFKRLENDVAVLKTDVAVLKTDVAVLKTDVRELKADLRSLNGRFDSLEGRFDSLDNRLIQTEIRLSTEITAVAGTLRDVHQLLLARSRRRSPDDLDD